MNTGMSRCRGHPGNWKIELLEVIMIFKTRIRLHFVWHVWTSKKIQPPSCPVSVLPDKVPVTLLQGFSVPGTRASSANFAETKDLAIFVPD